MNNNYSLEDYFKIINILDDMYYRFEKLWDEECQENKININFKTKQIKHIYNKKNNELKTNFLELLKIYYDLIREIEVGMKMKILDNTNKRIESRTKDIDSLLFKIDKKSREKDGSYPINKVVNDILGFRIIDCNYKENIKELKKIKCNIYPDSFKNFNRIKFVDRNKDTYKAKHIYFRGSHNKCIPMELQIWDKENEIENIRSHKKHKQGYISSIGKY